jgi:hypothetical protein
MYDVDTAKLPGDACGARFSNSVPFRLDIHAKVHETRSDSANSSGNVHALNLFYATAIDRRHAMPAATPTMFGFAGLLYLVIILFGISSEVLLRGPILAAGTPQAVADAIAARPVLLSLSIAADAGMVLADTGLAVLLFLILRPINAGLALAAMVLRLMQGAVIASGLLLLFAAQRPEFTGQALALMELHGIGYDVGLVFFGVNALLTGLLLWRLAGAARWIGLCIVASGFVYLMGSALRLAGPAASEAFAPAYGVPVLAESAFCIWLLIAPAGAVARLRRYRFPAGPAGGIPSSSV